MNPYFNFFLFIAIILILKIANKYFIPSKDEIKERFITKKLYYGLTSRYFLSKITDQQFEEYCYYFLDKQDYTNTTHISEEIEGRLSLICSKNKISKIYVSCFKATCEEGKNTNDNYQLIGRPYLQKFVGIMVHDEIHDGIVITNGSFSQEAKEYVKTLSEKYNIKLIDGIDLSKLSWEIRKRNVMKLLTE